MPKNQALGIFLSVYKASAKYYIDNRIIKGGS